MTSRPPPAIRDHETLRMIARGAFGEVWLARSVTGAYRAVKVVWREDYEQPEAFEREFEAVKHYEPVSRKHPGLVSVLQVGRSDTEGFYYYIMELADDLSTGRAIDPATYRPHTLGAQMRRDGRLPAADVLKFGANLAEGLHYLHESKLIHRDVKPSNLVFVNGECKLADLGLVALLGQLTFVGTEGFVAPEGPGSAASDVFSLGMVLYEASTGKDRLDFPDIPSFRESVGKLDLWQRLHRVICKACAPKASQRYESAHEMTLALRGEALPSTRRKTWIAGAAIASLLLVGVGMWIAKAQRRGGVLAVQQQAKPLLTIRSAPPKAAVFAGEDKLGETPLELNPAEGIPTLYELRLAGYKHYELEHTTDGDRPVVYDLKLETSRLPQIGQRWTNSLGMNFIPKQGGQVTPQPVAMTDFRKYVEAADRPFEGKVVRFQDGKDKEAAFIVVVPRSDADSFRYWLTDKDRSEGAMSQEHHYEIDPFYFVDTKGSTDDIPDGREPEPTSNDKDWQAFYLRVARQTYGIVTIKTQPPNVKVYQHDELLGTTPLELPRVRSGPSEFELRGDNFTVIVLEGDVKEGEILELYADMEKRRGVTYGREWKNSLGMRFQPLGEVLMAAWETRRRDYQDYAKNNSKRVPPPVDDTGKNGTQPIVGVDRDEARAFCAWLTKLEQEQGLISPEDYYRLPTDEEWSRAAGLPLERGEDPASRNGRVRGVFFPWGFEWPPPNRVDNLADMEAAKKAGLDNIIAGYIDQAPFTAPVSSLPPNGRGICGLGGNVSEWIDTDFEKPKPGAQPNPSGPLATTRGGNWRTATADEALSSVRIPLPSGTKRNTIGFRCVLARKALQ